MLQRVQNFMKKEVVLTISAVCAILSMFFAPPSPAYLGYIDGKVLVLLFSLMAVIAGLQECDLFAAMAQQLLKGRKQLRFICLVLVLLPFFTAMLITNDVALITFVPFTLLVLQLTGQTSQTIYIVVLQTIAANLGSMVTPVGNPQNLFLYTYFSIPTSQFFAILLPLALVSLVCLVLALLRVPSRTIVVEFSKPNPIREKRALLLYSMLFVLCLLAVFGVVPPLVLLVLLVGALVMVNPKLLKKIDYCLLLTFVCFFVFSGNMGQIPAISQGVAKLLQTNVAGVSALLSQVISNVPAALLLSGFTDHWQGLLIGTNLGGLGTPIASLASLISMKIYLRSPGAQGLRYLGVFLLLNVLFLAILFGAAWLLGLLA